MTDRPENTRGGNDGPALVVCLLLLTALLLAPGLWIWSQTLRAVQHPSTYDWMSNHDDKVGFAMASLGVFGAPLAGAFLGGIVAGLRGKRAGVGAATGACLAALVLLLCIVVGFFWLLSQATFEF
ncbi:hypothetical protein AB0K09_13970 [Streptomyces sp. NPDC049577]|uniref:hypothetical protein n=1 Tax=Streptomyces sp. NPDC049577 TaxID=3155153 RepID=UPI003439933A